MKERDETPAMESRSHSKSFLAKAARMAKRGKKRGKKMRKSGR